MTDISVIKINDHLSGCMTDISVMGEWQVAGMGGTRPLENVLGEALEGRFSFEARKLSLFFPEICSFRRFFRFPCFLKDLAPNVKALGLLVSTMSWRSFWKLRSVTGHFFFANSDYDHKYFLKISFLFPKAEPVLLAWQLWRSQGWPKHFGDGMSKTRMTKLTSGQWRDRAQKDHRSSSRLVRVVCGDPWSKWEKNKNKTRKLACDCVKSQPFIIFKPASFEELVSETRCRYRFALRSVIEYVDVQLHAGRSGCSAGKAKENTHPWHFRCWSPRRNERYWSGSLDGGIAPFFVRWCNYRCWFCVRKALWRWFYPRSRKIDHFQTLATGVPKLKTLLGTQRVNLLKTHLTSGRASSQLDGRKIPPNHHQGQLFAALLLAPPLGTLRKSDERWVFGEIINLAFIQNVENIKLRVLHKKLPV